VFDSHIRQQLPSIRAACRGKDLGPGRSCDRDRGLADPAGRRVDEYPLATSRASQVTKLPQ
jgi:hypothetical protein